MKNKAFTLIELLAVIVILGIIALIATPIILDVIESTRYSAFKESINNTFRSYEIYEAENEFEEIGKVDINNKDFPLESKFKTGQIYRNEEGNIEIENVSDGMYCAGGTIKKLNIVKGSCDRLNESEVKVNINKITTNSITVTTEAIDNKSGIKGIYYSINDDEYKNGESSYIFTKLESGKKYKIKVKVVNGSNVETIVEKEATTLTISMPEYSVDSSEWAQNKNVTITYPEITGQILTYEYSIDKGISWEIATKTQEVTFNSNGTIIARVKDGINTVTANTFTVDKIETVAPIISTVSGNTSTCSTSKTLIVSATDEGGSGIKEYSFDNGSTWQTSNSKSVSENKTYNIKVKDNAGNISNNYSLTTTMIDTDTKVTTPNAPELLSGLTPVKYSSGNWVVADKSTTWYDYSKQEWANAVILDDPYKSNISSGVTKNSGYASFDGTNDYINLGLENYSFGKNLTLAIRVKVKNDSKQQEFFGNWENAGGGLQYNNGAFDFYLYVNDQYNHISSNSVSINTYYTLVATYDGTTMKLYVNGSLVSSKAISGTILDSSMPVFIGANPGTSSNKNYSNIDVKSADIYNRTLSATEIKNGYSGETKIQNQNKLIKHVDFTTPEVGEIIPYVGMKGMFVWIPRYEYNVGGTYGLCGTGITTPGKIGINFIAKSKTTASSGYRIHPAFNFGGTQVSGIWVGKFETSAKQTSSCYSNPSESNCKTVDPYIIPNVNSLRYQNVSTQFTTAQKFKSYITGGDTHMAKNSEWGAITYLTQSKYGKYGNSLYTGVNKEVYENKSSSFITGSSNGTPATDTADTQCTYNTLTDRGSGTGSCGGGASTTGNITGIYDMSGGSREYVMGVYRGSGASSTWGASSDGTNYAGFTSTPNAKYFDSYTTLEPKTACSNGICYGQALSETFKWYSDYAEFITVDNPWLVRGSRNTDNSGIYRFHSYTGQALSVTTFRTIISPTS